MPSEELFWRFLMSVRKLRLAYRPFQTVSHDSHSDSGDEMDTVGDVSGTQSEMNRLGKEMDDCLRVYREVSKCLKRRKFHMEKGFFVALPYAYFRHWVLPLLLSGNNEFRLTPMVRTRLSELFAHVDLAHQRGVLATAEQGRSTMSERDEWCRQSKYWADGKMSVPTWIQNLKDVPAKGRPSKKAGAVRRNPGAGAKGKSRGGGRSKS